MYLVSVCYIEANRHLQLAEADGTEIQRSTIGLLQMIGALHHAAQPLTMPDSKHMTDLMRHRLWEKEKSWKFLLLKRGVIRKYCVIRNLAGSQQQRAADGWSVISIKHRIISLLRLKTLTQSTRVISAVEVVVVPGKTENTHPWEERKTTKNPTQKQIYI